jgi:hypothetical protein
LRYFFHYAGNGQFHEDEVGEQFASVEAATARARVLAAELRSDDDFYHSLVLSVIDENGNEVVRVPVGST